MTPEQHKELTRPFEPRKIKWRVGSRNKAKTSGMMLAYIDARDVMQRLDNVLGFSGWSTNIGGLQNGAVICTLTIDGVGKTDGADPTQVEPGKGGISDALKRSAVQWGIGRYLYYLDSPWIDLQNGYAPRDYKGQLPDFALPENWDQHYSRMLGQIKGA